MQKSTRSVEVKEAIFRREEWSSEAKMRLRPEFTEGVYRRNFGRAKAILRSGFKDEIDTGCHSLLKKENRTKVSKTLGTVNKKRERETRGLLKEPQRGKMNGPFNEEGGGQAREIGNVLLG